MVIKAVFFDMDGVLVYWSMSVEEYMSSLYQKLGLHFPVEQISFVHEEVRKWWKERFLSGQARTREAWKEYDYRILQGLGAKGDLRGLSERMQCLRENVLEDADEKLYSEVKGVLRKLQEKEINLAIISHRPFTLSLKSLEKHAIKRCFQFVVSPETAMTPKGKMSLEMWHFALDKIRVKPNEALHLDDSYEWILGAKKAGIQPVLVDRKGIYSSITDCCVIHDLTEIFEFL